MKNTNEYIHDTIQIVNAFSAGKIIATPTACSDIEMLLKLDDGKVMKSYTDQSVWTEDKELPLTAFRLKRWRIVDGGPLPN